MKKQEDHQIQEPSEQYPLSLIDISYRGVPKKDRERIRRSEMLRLKRHIRREKIHRKIVKGSVVSVLGLSMTIAGLFPSSSDLLRQQTIRQLENTNPVEMMLDEELPGSEEDDRRKAETSSSGTGFWGRWKAALRNMFLRIPIAVRTCVFLPLWAVGYLLLYLLSGVYQLVLAPVISHIIGFILCAVVLLGVFVLTMKSIFPHMPLKKILRWRNIRWILLGAAVLKVLDILLPMFWGEYTRYKYLVIFLAGSIVLGLIVIPRVRRHRQRALSHSRKGEMTG